MANHATYNAVFGILVTAFASTTRAQTITARSSTVNFNYVYGAGADTHTGGENIPGNTLLPNDSTGTGFSGSTSGVLPGEHPYAAGVSADLGQEYAIIGPLAAFRSIVAGATSHISASASGFGAAAMHASNPGNELVLNFTIDTPAHYHLIGSLTHPNPGAFSYVALERFNGFNWEYVFYSSFLPNSQGPFDVAGTLIPSPYRIHSVLSLDAGLNEDLTAHYQYRLDVRQPADMNCDGAVDGLDIQGFVEALLAPDEYRAHNKFCNLLNGDVDFDNAVTAADVAPFAQCVLNAGC